MKSSAAVINGFSQLLSQGLLNPDTAIMSEPTGFINIVMSAIGEKSATAFFEQQMYKNEALPSTALLVSSLIRQLDSSQIGKYFANPSNFTFVLGIAESDLLSRAVLQSNGDLMMVVNKNAVIQVGSYPQFTLDYNINIVISNSKSPNYTIYAVYDTSLIDSAISPIATPYIPSRRIVYNGQNYLALYINVRQYNRASTIVQLAGSDYRQDYYFPYANELMGFEVYYTPPGGSTPQLLTGQPIGVQNLQGYNFSINGGASSNSGGTVQFTFSRNPLAFQPTTGTLVFNIYNTQGSQGNFNMPNLGSSTTNIQFIPAQDKNVAEQLAYNGIIPIISIKSTATQGGRDQMSIDQLRSYVENQNRSGGNVISPGEIAFNAQNVGMTASQTRNDPLGIEWRMSGKVVTSDGIVVPTVMKNLALLIGQGNNPVTSFPLYKNDIAALSIPPGTIFNRSPNPLTSDSNEIDYVLSTDETSDAQYTQNYQNGQNSDYVFPYLIRVVPSGNLATNVYDTSVNASYATDFIFFNLNSQDRASITSVGIYRNATIKDQATGYGIYQITFQVNVGDNIIQALKGNNSPSPIICKILFTAANDPAQQFVANAYVAKNSDGSLNISGNLVTFEADLYTDDSITDTPAIVIRNSSITPFPFIPNPSNYYPLEALQNVQIYTILQTIGGATRPVSQYDSILTPADINNGYYVSTIYEATDISLFSDLTNEINIQPDISVSQPVYKRYASNVYSKYTSTQYAQNPDGTYMTQNTQIQVAGTGGVMETQTLTSFIPLHDAGDIEFNVSTQNNPTISLNQNNIVPQSDFVSGATVNASSWTLNNSVYACNINIVADKLYVYFYYLNITTPAEVILQAVINSSSSRITMSNIGNGIFQAIIPLLDNNGNPVSLSFNFTYAIGPMVTTPDIFEVTPIILNQVGSLVLDANGNPQISVAGNVILLLRDVPMYDRIFSIDRFEDILTGYQSLLSEVTALAANIPDGCSLYAGVWQTTGPGLWRLKSNNSILNDLALSFKIGFKLIQNAYGVDPNYISQQISSMIVSYVNSFTGYEFSVMKMLDYIMTQIPSIDYFEFYDMNIYGIDYQGSGNAQTIFVNSTDQPNATNQALSIKYSVSTQNIIDATTGNITGQQLIFTPAITILQLT